MTDPEGLPLVSVQGFNRFRLKPVWAVYSFRKGYSQADMRSSDFLPLVAAQSVADSLNSKRHAGENCYFRVCRAGSYANTIAVNGDCGGRGTDCISPIFSGSGEKASLRRFPLAVKFLV